jgi:hypothetical protein
VNRTKSATEASSQQVKLLHKNLYYKIIIIVVAARRNGKKKERSFSKFITKIQWMENIKSLLF